MKNLWMTKSNDCKSDFVKRHASRPCKSTGKLFLKIVTIIYLDTANDL